MRLGTLLFPSVLIVAIAFAGAACAVQQTIELHQGWNLISFAVQPDDVSPDAVLAPLLAARSFVALWTYDTDNETWSGFTTSDVPPGFSAISAIETGKGYWLDVTRAGTFTVSGDETALPAGARALSSGWNLVGFTAEEPLAYDRLFSSPPVREIWTYDAAAARFAGIVFPAGGIGPNLRQDFTQLEPGQAYWVLTDGPVVLEPVLGTALPSDVDNPPLLPDGPPDMRKVWMAVTPGDEDIGADGFFDVPTTQRALTFRDNSDTQYISIFNAGKGILNWTATIEAPDDHAWLRFRTLDEQGHDITYAALSGSVSTETDRIDLIADRTGLAAGDYRATVTIGSNGAGPDPERTIDVFMRVAGLDGDYEIRAEIDTVNGKPADTANPRLFVSLYHDRDGLKAAIDERRSLLFPQRVRLAGRGYETGTNKFVVSGAFELPPRDPGNPDDPNPYQVALRREITLIGDRRTSLHDAELGPLDLKGEYHETIRNVLSEPIHLAGTFIANRVDTRPTVTDDVEILSPQGASIPDNGTFTRTFTVTQRVLLTEVDIRINVTHSRPSDLVITLMSPTGELARLRDHSPGPLGVLTYDDDEPPVDSMDVFNGELAAGTWTLRIADEVPGETGSFLNGTLMVRGTEVHSITGTVPAGESNATVLLSGCGVSRVARAVGATYQFSDLIDCVYRITIHESGFADSSVDVVLDRSNVSAPTPPPPVGTPPDGQSQLALPKSPGACGTNCFEFTSLTTAGGAGVIHATMGEGAPIQRVNALQYGADAATFDIDRPCRGVTCCTGANCAGPEDTDYFVDVENPTTKSNECAAEDRTPFQHCLQPGDGKIDPPKGANAEHIFLAAGLPVIGTSASPDGRLTIGAAP